MLEGEVDAGGERELEQVEEKVLAEREEGDSCGDRIVS